MTEERFQFLNLSEVKREQKMCQKLLGEYRVTILKLLQMYIGSE